MAVHETTGSESPRNDPVAGAPSDNVTLVELIEALDRDGFSGQFITRPDAHVECSQCHARVPAAELKIAVARRLEGASDPADMSLVVAATCPRCAAGGTLVVGYGANAVDDDAAIGAAIGAALRDALREAPD